MARNMYGATSADFTLTAAGRVVPGAVLTVWTARTGGTQVTDLLDADSVAATTVTSGGDGSVVFYGPDETRDTLWLSSGQGSRVAVRPVSILGTPAELAIGTVTTGTAAVTISGDETAGYELDFVLPSAGANGVDTAAIQAKAVTAAKIADDTITATQIAANAVGASELAAGAVTYDKLARQPGNLLSENQATCGDASGDTAGLDTAGGSTVARTTATAYQGSGCLQVTATGTSYLTAGLAAGTYVPVTPGETYTASVWSKAATTGRAASVNVEWKTVGGTTISTSSSAATTNSTSAWSQHQVTAVAPATAAFAYLYWSASPTAVSEVHYIDNLLFARGVGGSWQLPGVPIPGQGAIKANGAVELPGGDYSPEGTVTANPGSTFLQTSGAATVTGMLSWRKATGTGNTGWVAEGALADTGWRDVLALLDSDATARVQTWTNVRIRRIGQVVTFLISGTVGTGTASGTSAAFRLLTAQPTGFWATGNNEPVGYLSYGNAYVPCVVTYSWTNGYPVVGAPAGNWGASSFGGQVSYLTADAWPSSLPGSAA